MNSIIFYLTYPFIWFLSILPMRILYILADVIFIFTYYVFNYRKDVILTNINYAFPEKSDEYKKKVAKKFYRHFSDLVVESIKAFTISKKNILKRYKYTNPELVDKYAKQGKSIALVGAHQANWEWSINLPLALKSNIFGAYSKLRNEVFEKKLLASRQKFGVSGTRTSEFKNFIKQKVENNIQGAYILLSDQSPQIVKTLYWSEFFGVKVPVHTGAEMLAKKHNFVVINYRAKKVKRGYYEADFELITENPRDYKDYEITKKFLAITERNIKEQPECYLWSHKRFKHKDKFDEWQKIMAAKK